MTSVVFATYDIQGVIKIPTSQSKIRWPSWLPWQRNEFFLHFGWYFAFFEKNLGVFFCILHFHFAENNSHFPDNPSPGPWNLCSTCTYITVHVHTCSCHDVIHDRLASARHTTDDRVYRLPLSALCRAMCYTTAGLQAHTPQSTIHTDWATDSASARYPLV